MLVAEIKVRDSNQAIPYVLFIIIISGPSTLELAQKELAAHKEMVTELRNHLIEKEEELQVGSAINFLLS